ncbi:MAG TPA: hypothetical protein VFZ89_08870 [Solirubrobacteraceae bacterium]
MSKLLGFVIALAALFGVGLVAGDLIGPEPKEETEAHAGSSGGGHGAAQESGGEHGATAAAAVRGLASAANGMRLVVETPELRRGRSERLTFRIVDDHGETIRDFEVEHEKRLHLIIARRDLTAFQHLHPRQRPDGSWTTPVRIDDAGSYRVFADFVREGTAETLAGDLRVDGPADLRAIPEPRPTASDAGYDVRLDAATARPGKAAELEFTVTKDGKPVAVQPYLGARGHLVALRDGDLAYLHVHPEEHGHGIAFGATFPTSGRYRLFLQFKHNDRVRTVAFTKDVA